jgi:hypothetical protein
MCYTANGVKNLTRKVDMIDRFIGESSNYQVFLFLILEIVKLKNLALTLVLAIACHLC